jgi:hypothetical protein
MKDIKTVSDLSAMINRDALARAKADINMAFSALVTEVPRAKLPEHIFKNLFLPVLSGAVNVEEADRIYVYWISVAGSPTAEIDVIDTKNNVLFTLPPVINSEMINSVDRRTALQDIYTEGKLRENNLPILGQQYLIPRLGNKVQEFLSSTTDDRAIKITEILARYDIKPKNTEVKQVTAVIDDDDDLVY